MSESADAVTIPRTLTQAELDACEGILAGESPLVAFQRATGKTSRTAFDEFFENAEIQAYLAARRMELRERTGFSDQRWIEEVSNMAFLDPAEIVNTPLTCPADIAKLPEHVRRAIVGWEYDVEGHFRIKLASKQKALDMLAKNQGLYQKDRTNDRDAANLLQQAFWRFVISLHVQEGISIDEAKLRAHRAPEEVKAWAQARGLPTSGEIQR